VAQGEAAEAKRQADIASSAANQATNAASTAQALASTAAQAARKANAAAKSAAGHAEKAADAAEEAVKYAGQAIDFANKSTAHADEAVKAANVATQAIVDALAVEKNARAAEAAALAADKLEGMKEAAQLALVDKSERAAALNKRTQAQQTAQATKDLIAKAEQALGNDDLPAAATIGRQAAVALLNSKGTWTRQAARFALAGSDYDVHSWIDIDRQIAESQDNRETILFIAQVSEPAVAKAAVQALAGGIPAEGDFNTSGVIRSRADDNRVNILKILHEKPGKAVTKAANDALNANTPEALQKFFDEDLPKAVEQDDAVATMKVVANGDAYSKAYAEVAMEGPAWMRRNFIESVLHKAAQLDYDSLSHAAAMQATIAAAAKIAQEAQRDAALASEVAAVARDAGQKAREWAQKAVDSAKQADDYATKAREHADAADKSAADAQASANKAKDAAATAQSASRAANYSANRAIDAARSAQASAYSAQASAANAHQAELAAGRDAKTAAAAAAEARQIAADKRTAEVREAARVAAEQAQKDRDANRNPSNTTNNDQVNPKGSQPGKDEWWNDAKWWADSADKVSTAAGLLAAGFAVSCVFFPAAPVLGSIAAVCFGVSVVAAGVSAIASGIEYGFTSGEFVSSAGRAALGLVTRGGGRAASAVAKPVVKTVEKVAGTASKLLYDLVA
ncbi:ALF repeat-containing protein, partial [Streptomyces sp. NPDC056492]